MPCGGCKGSKRRPVQQKPVTTAVPAVTKEVDGFNTVLLEYTGSSRGPYRVNGQPPTNARYRFGLNESHKFGYVYPHDVAFLLGKFNQDKTPVFKIVEAPPQKEEAAKPEDFVGQKVEDTPKQEEQKITESFVLDIHMNDLTIAGLKELLADPKYINPSILSMLHKQEVEGKTRKTALKLLEKAIDNLP